MRIIAGTLKGRRLHGPEPGDFSIRPTSDRAREALFSILQRWPQGGFLDLCAGTGAVGLEAISRGYSPVICVERDRKAQVLLAANAKGTTLQLQSLDIRKLRANSFHDVSIVFADPPYADSPGLWESLESRIRAWLAPDGLVVWETDSKTDLTLPESWDLVDSRVYSAVKFHLLQPKPPCPGSPSRPS